MTLIFAILLAYIPQNAFLLKKISEHHGKGAYRITQEVLFEKGNDRFVVTEIWTTDGSEAMHLEARSSFWKYSAKYRSQNRFVLSAENKIQIQKISADFFEPIFTLQNERAMGQWMMRSGITGAQVLQAAKRFNNLKDIEYRQQDFVRLGRTQGRIAYVYGAPSSPDGAQVFPALWVEQDTFRVLQVRTRSNTEIAARDYQQYSQNLNFPSLRELQLSDMRVVIRTIKVDAIKLDSNDNLLKSTSTIGLNANEKINHPLISRVEDFYKNYR